MPAQPSLNYVPGNILGIWVVWFCLHHPSSANCKIKIWSKHHLHDMPQGTNKDALPTSLKLVPNVIGDYSMRLIISKVKYRKKSKGPHSIC